MDHDSLLKNLKSLKRIEPDAAFTQTLRFELLEKGFRAVPPTLRSGFRLNPFAISVALASLILIASATFVIAPHNTSVELAGLNNEELLGELVSTGDINIYLYEISYNNDANERINVALREVTDSHAE